MRNWRGCSTLIRKQCSKCGLWLPPEDFWDDKGNKSGKKAACKVCLKSKKKRDPADSRRYNYGLTSEEYDTIGWAQNYCCAICGVKEEELVKVSTAPLNQHLHVDHNHVTGEVRGLLCFRCNHGLGKFQDSIEFLEAAADYLRNYTHEPDF